jgi:N utilization substance protein B
MPTRIRDGERAVRRRARELALHALFRLDLTGETDPQEVLDTLFQLDLSGESDAEGSPTLAEGGAAPEPIREITCLLVRGTMRRLAEIDPLISVSAEHWRLPRMSAVDRSLLRLAVFEALHADPPTPPVVAIDEAVELAKLYGTEQSGAFVNGVLDHILKSLLHPPEESGQDE